jgi:trigger factor
VNTSVEKISETRVRLSVEVSFAELNPWVDSAYEAVSGKVNIPGFRKGKVPKTLIDQRVGRPVVLDEAINAAIPNFYRDAAREHKVNPIGRPEVDVKELVDNEKLVLDIEVDVRPNIILPNFSEMTVTVPDVNVTDAEVNEQADELRARFGTLHDVEKSAETGDFVSIDLTALVEGKEIDGGTVKDVSYEVGSNRMVDGLDEALAGMNKGDEKSFTSTLMGMADGQTAEIQVAVKAIKQRDLPAADDAFAKMASEFESYAELLADVKTRLEKVKGLEQGALARDLLVDRLMNELVVALPENLIDDEVNRHLESEGRLEDAAHRAEVIESTTKTFKQEIIFDTIVDAESINVTEQELSEYLFRSAARYGMTPEQFVKEVTEAGQVNALVSEVARAKALAQVLSRVKVVTESGKAIDLEALRPDPQVFSAEDVE